MSSIMLNCRESIVYCPASFVKQSKYLKALLETTTPVEKDASGHPKLDIDPQLLKSLMEKHFKYDLLDAIDTEEGLEDFLGIENKHSPSSTTEGHQWMDFKPNEIHHRFQNAGHFPKKATAWERELINEIRKRAAIGLYSFSLRHSNGIHPKHELIKGWANMFGFNIEIDTVYWGLYHEANESITSYLTTFTLTWDQLLNEEITTPLQTELSKTFLDMLRSASDALHGYRINIQNIACIQEFDLLPYTLFTSLQDGEQAKLLVKNNWKQVRPLFGKLTYIAYQLKQRLENEKCECNIYIWECPYHTFLKANSFVPYKIQW